MGRLAQRSRPAAVRRASGGLAAAAVLRAGRSQRTARQAQRPAGGGVSAGSTMTTRTGERREKRPGRLAGPAGAGARARANTALPFLAIGTACVIAGGFVAAVTAHAPAEHASWAAAYLVLVAGVAQMAGAPDRRCWPHAARRRGWSSGSCPRGTWATPR